MMQIFNEAIELSRSGETKYVLAKNDDVRMCEYGEELLRLFKDGYELCGRFRNGNCYDSFIVERTAKQKEDFDSVREVIEKIVGFSYPDVCAISLSFQTFYDRENLVDGVNLDVSLYVMNTDGVFDVRQGICLTDDDAKLVGTVIHERRIKQSKYGLIEKLEKDFAK